MSALAKSNAIFNGNRLKLGTFGTNGRGATLTTSPDAHRPSWENNLRAAQLADSLGFEALLAFARWKGFLKDNISHPSGVVLDPFTWAAAIAQATNYSTIFATTHAPTVHPLVVAKQSATIDLISNGRFGLNVVGGWNKPEFDMFGATLAEHDQRYEYLEEWLGVLEMLWSAKEEFDFSGRFLKLTGAVSMPQPLQQPRPPIMNAGGSGRGMRFACEHADMCFVTITNQDPEAARKQILAYKNLAREEFGRDVGVWTLATVVQRETRQEAEEYLQYFATEYQDSVAVDAWISRILEEAQGRTADQMKQMRMRIAAAAGGELIVGTSIDIADRLEALSEIGIDGCLLAWNDFSDGLRRFGEGTIQELERRGLRAPFSPSASESAEMAPV